MENSKIEWCDHTFNPWEGCTKVSPGCAHCYAETRNARWNGGKAPNWGPGAPRRRTSEANWRKPLAWNREAERAFLSAAHSTAPGKRIVSPRPRVFCASLADWLDDEVPIEWLAELLDLIRQTPALDWLLLTKRPENWHKRLLAAWCFSDLVVMECDRLLNSSIRETRAWIDQWLGYRKEPSNIWIGTTVEDQKRADERIPELLKIPARVRFLSCEPLLSDLNLRRWLVQDHHPEPNIHWVIAGGESGLGARPMHPDWARSLRDQCAAAGVPFLFKQWGEWAPVCRQYPETDAEHDEAEDASLCADIALEPDGSIPEGYQPISPRTWLMDRVGKKAAGRLLDGVEHNEFPASAV